MDADLFDGVPFPYGPGQNFGVDQGAGAVHFDGVKYFAFIEFERTVNVFQFQIEQKTDQSVPAESV